MIEFDSVEWRIEAPHNEDFVIHIADIGMFRLNIWEDSVTINPRVYIKSSEDKYVNPFSEESGSIDEAKHQCIDYINSILNSVRK